jgi:hypothetical protein
MYSEQGYPLRFDIRKGIDDVGGDEAVMRCRSRGVYGREAAV